MDVEALLLVEAEEEPLAEVDDDPATALEVILASRGPILRVPQGFWGADTQLFRYVPKCPVWFPFMRTCVGR